MSSRSARCLGMFDLSRCFSSCPHADHLDVSADSIANSTSTGGTETKSESSAFKASRINFVALGGFLSLSSLLLIG